MSQSDDLQPVESTDAGLDRRSAIKKVAVGGAAVWAAPTIMGVASAAQASPATIPTDDCPPEHTPFMLYVKWDPDQIKSGYLPPNTPTTEGFVPAGANDSTGNCLAKEEAIPAENSCVVNKHLAHTPYQVSYTNKDGTPAGEYDIETVTLTILDEHCDGASVIKVKEGKFCSDADVTPTSDPDTVIVGGNIPQGTSHIEFKIQCCIHNHDLNDCGVATP